MWSFSYLCIASECVVCAANCPRIRSSKLKLNFEPIFRRRDGFFFRLEGVMPSALANPLNRRRVGDKISIASTKYHTYMKNPIVQKRNKKK